VPPRRDWLDEAVADPDFAEAIARHAEAALSEREPQSLTVTPHADGARPPLGSGWPSRSESAAPYYQDDAVTLYHADARAIMPHVAASVLVTDPPYPNNAGHFSDAVTAAREVLSAWTGDTALVFWSELETPPVPLPLVAVHIWHRANVNGRPYEPVYHFAADAVKRRSEVIRYAVEFPRATGAEYLGHPTQKPVRLMQRLIAKTAGVVVDPFAGVGSTLRAAKNLGRQVIGIEIAGVYCATAALRLGQEVLSFA
jgi:site-specific DNA-methyltransferase (adenine-specific)